MGCFWGSSVEEVTFAVNTTITLADWITRHGGTWQLLEGSGLDEAGTLRRAALTAPGKTGADNADVVVTRS